LIVLPAGVVGDHVGEVTVREKWVRYGRAAVVMPKLPLAASLMRSCRLGRLRSPGSGVRNPWVAAAVDGLVGNVVGAGIKPQSTHPDRAVRERLQVLWLRWKTMPIRVAARYQGIRIVEYNGKRVTYATDADMAAALVDLNRQISDTTARIAVVRNCRVRKGIGSFARAVTTSPEREPCNQAPLGRLSLSCLLLPGPAIGAATCRAVFWIRSSLSAMQRVSPFRVCSLNVRPLVSP
jgi:hypothetical protein